MNTNKLKGLLIEKGYTYYSFSQKIGISKDGLALLIKKGRTNTDTLIKICKELNVESKTLLEI